MLKISVHLHENKYAALTASKGFQEMTTNNMLDGVFNPCLSDEDTSQQAVWGSLFLDTPWTLLSLLVLARKDGRMLCALVPVVHDLPVALGCTLYLH